MHNIAEVEEPAVIYSPSHTRREVRNGSIRMKTAMKETLIYEGQVSSMAFDPVRRELFWSNYARSEETKIDETSGTFRLILGKNGNAATQFAPQPFPFQIKGGPWKTFSILKAAKPVSSLKLCGNSYPSQLRPSDFQVLRSSLSMTGLVRTSVSYFCYRMIMTVEGLRFVVRRRVSAPFSTSGFEPLP